MLLLWLISWILYNKLKMSKNVLISCYRASTDLKTEVGQMNKTERHKTKASFVL